LNEFTLLFVENDACIQSVYSHLYNLPFFYTLPCNYTVEVGTMLRIEILFPQ